ncbi:hypothetical protein [Burkholderia gladioli]|uniref:hypothetical protein n=1 Tax=Burkholderia gladioli TaxID=28095 RepID=UPI001640D8D3|nr:hypothetical protein [Burkholderia gladioli]
MQIKVAQPAGKSPTTARVRIVKMIELDSVGNETSPPKFAVVEDSDPCRVLKESFSYQEVVAWKEKHFPSPAP